MLANELDALTFVLSRREYDFILKPIFGPLAQLVEHITLNDGVVGSKPTRTTIFYVFTLNHSKL